MPINIGSLTLKSRVYVPPMAGVTDLVFRSIVRRIDPECMLATEMVSSKALMHRPEKTRIMDLNLNEKPTGIQIFGHEPDVMAYAAKMAEAHGADFVDINMGCPVPKITKGKDGCALMREPDLAREIVETVKASINIPLTVKFRLGWDDDSRNAVEFGQMLEKAGACAVTVHGRTRQQLYSGKADWDFIAQVKKGLSIPVFGNGDVFEPEDAIALLEKAGVDGVAVARGTLGNPWLIPRITKYIETGILDGPPRDIERLISAYLHCVGLIRYKGSKIGTNESRRHLTHYTKGIVGSAPYRARLTQIENAHDAAVILAELAEMVEGTDGKKEFLLAVEQENFENGKDPGKRDSNCEGSIHAPIDFSAVSPFAKP
ncbi:MAG: tRNA dihydrouridine synthase DusB [Candidatus Obscuribacterales bacterium]|nr:tRNA dihydrouridine synthase DusB [Candidatus Obscuribacterales bacterium]